MWSSGINCASCPCGLLACQAGSLFERWRPCVGECAPPDHLIVFASFPDLSFLPRHASALLFAPTCLPLLLSTCPVCSLQRTPPHLTVDDATVEKATVSLERGGTWHELTNVREWVHSLSVVNNLKLGALRGGPCFSSSDRQWLAT
jgi:hypothetical protein